jgi:hypothetical protein
MAIYETGASTGVNDLIDKVRVFALANGWTVNQFGADGAGYRLHLQLGSDVFFNLRSLVNERAQGTAAIDNLVYGLACNGSTGYNGASAWYAQPGAPANTTVAPNTDRFPYGLEGISGSITAYHLFARSNMIYLVVEYSAGNYQWLMFGQLDKLGSWTGGQVYAATANMHTSGSGTGTPNDHFFGEWPWPTGDVRTHPYGFVYGTVDGVTGWVPGRNSVSMNPAVTRCFDSIVLQSLIVTNAANQFNTLPMLLPVSVQMMRDGVIASGQWSTVNNFSIEAYLPDIFFCNLRTLVPGQTLSVSTQDFKVFPFRAKRDVGISNSTTSGWLGFAIKSN